MTELIDLVRVLDDISSTTKRKEKTKLLGDFLRAIDDTDIEIATLFLAGRTFAESDERSLNMSWAGIISAIQRAMEIDVKEIEKHYAGDAGEAIASVLSSSSIPRQQGLFDEALTLGLLYNTFQKIAALEGKGSKNEKEALLSNLFQSASPREVRYLVALILGDMRTGISDAMVLEGISEAFAIDSDLLRRAWSFCGDLGKVARISRRSGKDGIASITVEVFTPIRPMLATPADSISKVVTQETDELYLELKYDGARVQIHKDNGIVRIFSRRLNEVTDSLPEIAEQVAQVIDADRVILDGEVIAVNQGIPAPFQEVMKRFGRIQDIDRASDQVEVQLFIFDIILKDDECLVDFGYTTRRSVLESVAPAEIVAPRYAVTSIEESTDIFERSKELGHEGIMIKRGNSTYIPGKRGKHWYKIKHTLPTLDMIVMAAEWGHGRRSKWLSDYHLGVFDTQLGEFVMVGKTFKGLTDIELETMTKRFQDISYESKRGVVRVKPQVVVEVLVSELQKSPTYNSGIALRFARIKRIRDDLGPSDVVTLQELEDLYQAQFEFKSR